MHRNGGEIVRDRVKIIPHMRRAEAAPLLEIRHQPVHPFLDVAVGFALHQLVRAALVRHVHDQIAIDHGIGEFAYHTEAQGKTGVFLQSGQVDGHHRNIVVARAFQRFAQQMDIVGRPAAAARLGDEQRQLVGIIFAAAHCLQQLTDHQQRRIASVVVDIFQSGIHNAAVGSGEHIHLVTVQLEHLAQHGEVHRQHLRHQQGVFLLHLFGKQQPPGFVIL